MYIDIYSAPFHLAMAHYQCRKVNARNGGFNTLCSVS